MLRDTFVRQTKQEGRFSDGRGGNGLALIVRRRADGTLSKTWTQRLTIHGRRTNLGLGRYPVVTLAQARSLALENAQMALEGEDPRARDKVPTFRELAEKVMEGRRSRWTDAERREHRRSEHQWRRSLEMHAAPLLDRPVDVITTREVIRALEKVWQEHPETGRRVLGRVREVMAKAVAYGHCTSNPAFDAPAGLPPQPNTPVVHVPSTPHAEVGSVIAAINASRADKAMGIPPNRGDIVYEEALCHTHDASTTRSSGPVLCGSSGRREGRSLRSPAISGSVRAPLGTGSAKTASSGARPRV